MSCCLHNNQVLQLINKPFWHSVCLVLIVKSESMPINVRRCGPMAQRSIFWFTKEFCREEICWGICRLQMAVVFMWAERFVVRNSPRVTEPWLLTSKGLCVCDQQSGRFHAFRPNSTTRSAIVARRVGRLWTGLAFAPRQKQIRLKLLDTGRHQLKLACNVWLNS